MVVVQGYLPDPVSPAQFRDILRDTFDHNRLSGQHLLGNTHIAFAGDKAHAVTEFMTVTLEEAPEPDHALRQVTAGLYVDDLVRHEGDWRIARRTLSRKSSNEDRVPFLPPIADAVRLTLRTGWPFPFRQDETAP